MCSSDLFPSHDIKTKVAKYSAWYEVIDAMRGIESIPVSELLQMAFSAGVEAAEQSVQPTVLTRCPNDGNLLLMGFCDQCKSQYPHSG